jgi:hypothetical protein
MTFPRVLILLVFLSGLAGLLAKDIDYASRPARGLAIYKKNDFASDNSAILLEYRAFTAHDRVSYLVTAGGTRLTIPVRGSSLLLIPYPGKGEATPQQALAVIEFTNARYPKYRAHLAPLKAAWRKEAERPASEIQKEVALREKNKQTGLAFVEWLKSLSSNLPPLKIPPSLLDGARPGQVAKSAETEGAKGAKGIKGIKESEEAEVEKSTEPDPQDFKANLKLIQEAYKALNALESEQP